MYLRLQTSVSAPIKAPFVQRADLIAAGLEPGKDFGPGWTPVQERGQLVLDLDRGEVVEYL